MKKRKGATLVLVLIIGVFLSILGSTVLFLSNSEALKTTRQTEKMKAYYAARSGADAMADWMTDKTIQEVKNYVGKSTDWNKLGDENGLEYRVLLEENDSSSSILHIVSEGRYNNITQRVVLTYQAVNDAQEYLFDMAVFASDSITMGNGSRIIYSELEGKSGTGVVTNAHSINYNGSRQGTIYGDLYLGAGASDHNIANPGANIIGGKVGRISNARSYLLPDFPVYPKLEQKPNLDIKNKEVKSLNQSGQYSNIEIKNGGTLELNSGSQTLEIRIEKLNLKGELKVIGSGKVIIYVDNLELDGNIISPQKDKFLIYCKNDLKINSNIKATVYSLSDIELVGNPQISGNIISAGNINLGGAALMDTSVIYAPKGSVSISGSSNDSKIYGSIIAKHLNIGNNIHLSYFPIKTEDFPFEIPGAGSKYNLDYWNKDTN